MLKDTIVRLVRYGIVGAGSNLILYGLYIAMTMLGVAPEIATTIAFMIGITATYLINRSWTFKSSADHKHAAPRYIAAYGSGYLVQLASLSLTYRWLDIPHQLGQLIAMVLAAGTIFAMLNFWVFSRTPQSDADG